MKKKIIFAAIVMMLLTALCGLSASAATEVASGTCGANLTWVLDDAGTLTISGTGAMDAWASAEEVPWHSQRNAITSVVLGIDVTSIGNYAFCNCANLVTVYVPGEAWRDNEARLVSIGDCAFADCSSLYTITIPHGVVSLGDRVFYNCDSLPSIVLPRIPLTYIGKDVFTDCAKLQVYAPYYAKYTGPNAAEYDWDNYYDNASALETTSAASSIYTSFDVPHSPVIYRKGEAAVPFLVDVYRTSGYNFDVFVSWYKADANGFYQKVAEGDSYTPDTSVVGTSTYRIIVTQTVSGAALISETYDETITVTVTPDAGDDLS